MLKQSRDQLNSPDTSSKRAKATDRACNACRKAKTRCDKAKPTCSTCHSAKRDCTYDSISSRHATNEQATSSKHPHSSDDTKELKGPATSFSKRARQHVQDAQTWPEMQSLGSILFSDSAQAQQAESEHDPMSFTSHIDQFEPSPVPSQLWVSTAPQLRWMSTAGVEHEKSAQTTEQYSAVETPTSSGTARSQRQSDAETILQSLAESSDSESAMTLAALRLGVPVHELAIALDSKTDLLDSINRFQEAAPVDPQLHGLLQGQEKITWGSIMFDRLVWTRIKYAPTLKNRYEHVGAFIKGHSAMKRRLVIPPLEKSDEALDDTASDSTELPFWAIPPMHDRKNSMDPFENALESMRGEINAETDLEKYCGAHAYVGAFLDARQFDEAPRLSQITAALTRSMLVDAVATDFTAVALMYLHWSVWNWLLRPTPHTYDVMPENMRATPWQLFAPHFLIYDFCITPGLRDHLCQAPLDDNHWISEACNTVVCEWPKTMSDAVKRDDSTGGLDLSPGCKTHVAQTDNWSLGQSVRPYFPNIDRYIKIRSS